MKRLLFSPPEPFSLSPMLSLLPTVGKIGRLEALTSALYARYEKVVSLKREIEDSAQNSPKDRQILKRFSSEEQMLKEVLDWLAVKPEGGE